MIRYGGRLFRPVRTSDGSQTSDETIFKYEQVGDLVMARYSGGHIRYGQLIGHLRDDGILDMRYHHMDRDGNLKTGICLTTPEELPGGKLRLHERWRWTCGDESKGTSILEEI